MRPKKVTTKATKKAIIESAIDTNHSAIVFSVFIWYKTDKRRCLE